MLAKCICTYCAGHLEFEEENAGEKIKCPHCGFETTLFLPGEEPAGEGDGGDARRSWFSRRAGIIAAAVILPLAALGYSVHRWVLPPIKDWLNTESALLPVLVFLGGLLAVCLVLVWTVFPVLLLMQIKRLTSHCSALVLNPRPAVPADLDQEKGDGEAGEPDKEPVTTRRV